MEVFHVIGAIEILLGTGSVASRAETDTDCSSFPVIGDGDARYDNLSFNLEEIFLDTTHQVDPKTSLKWLKMCLHRFYLPIPGMIREMYLVFAPVSDTELLKSLEFP
jgi:hypothetical protein